MNLASIDLNLLLVFRALMTHRSATRAGQEIGLSQPAVSNALTRLRHHYRDPLFLRTRDGMEPTLKARELAPPIDDALAKIERTLPSQGSSTDAARFDPTDIDRQVNIAFVDYGGLHLVSRLVEILVRQAPGMELLTHPTDAEGAISKLRRAEIDFAVGVFPVLPAGWKRKNLFVERSVVTVSRDHPRIGDSLTMDAYTSERHVGVSPLGIADRMLADGCVARRFAVSASLLSVPFIVQRSDLVATLPSGVAKTFKSVCHLRIFELPIQLQAYGISLVTHPRSDRDKPLAWLLGIIEAIAADLRVDLDLPPGEPV